MGSAASIIAVLDLSVKVASLCFQYSQAVKNARPDIERLCGELDALKTTLEAARELLQSPNGTLLRTSQRLRDGLDGSSSQLTELQTKLEEKVKIGTTRKVMRRVQALKWPFESKDINGIIATLARYQKTLSFALTVDQAYVTGYSPGFLKLIRSAGRKPLISTRRWFSPNSPLPRMLPSIHMPTSMTRDATPKPELLSAEI